MIEKISIQNMKETQIRIINNADNPVMPNVVEVYSVNVKSLGFTGNAKVYAEGYQMLHQTHLAFKDISPDIGTMDKDHYKMPQTKGYFTAYNYIYFEENGRVLLLGASSCRSYRTEIRINQETINLVQILEGRRLESGAELQLESYVVIEGTDRNEILDEFAGYINGNHPKRGFREVPDGWCSWYCYGPVITEGAINKNLKHAKLHFPELKYIQIDDGYQPHMGDWLEQTKKFRHKMKDICLNIRSEGFEPAMWVAPFISSEKSHVFRNNPGWFIKDESGVPLCTEKVTFRGWRDAPWYFLDPTHPEALEYIKNVFRIMKHEWKVDYFKLDANCWGALPFGVRFNNDVTSVEAYRIGLEALWEVCGADTYLLGCNAPLWPSLGIVNGMRVTNDIDRNIGSIKALSMQCFYRNWMHGKLWINDPDCLVQVGMKTGIMASFSIKAKKVEKRNENEAMYRYAATFIRASGGMVLSGDRLYSLSRYDIGILMKLIGSERTAAKFNGDYSVGTIETEQYTDYLLFNESKEQMNFNIKESGTYINMFDDKAIVTNDVLKIILDAEDAGWYRLNK
jgi:alpha-galactosidase